MIDSNVKQLLEHAIDTLPKLHLLLIFYENPRVKMSPSRVAEQSCRDIWSVSEALQELVESGILGVIQQGSETLYSYQPHPAYTETIPRLVHGYNDPLERNELYRFIRDLANVAALRRDSRNMAAMIFQ